MRVSVVCCVSAGCVGTPPDSDRNSVLRPIHDGYYHPCVNRSEQPICKNHTNMHPHPTNFAIAFFDAVVTNADGFLTASDFVWSLRHTLF